MCALAVLVPKMEFDLGAQLHEAYASVSVEAGAFLLLALILQRRNLAGLMRRVWPQGARVNLLCLALEVVLLMPLLGMLLIWMYRTSRGWQMIWAAELWNSLPACGVLLIVVFLADGISYVRHRLEHTRWFWPIHAMHHSDRELTWFSAYRQHPLNRLNAALIDIGILLLLGVPLWAIYANALVRHYYGLLTHANVPWTFGWLGRVLVSPAMHRWHHVRQGEGVGKNFATVFSVFDQAFGTYYVPSACREPTGLDEPGHNAFLMQVCSPFMKAVAALRTASMVRQDRPRIEE
ncbi:sterol desaturase family protein [Stenotrophomonas maltophilia]|uniref:sterol desaturase family protein n=1 Tax=Stenotrophomonas maltophilia TaxID=40324 RepID=UPI0015F3D2E9|nr:sterol desaturase family protein [Stenotrophomonas maltophilia]